MNFTQDLINKTQMDDETAKNILSWFDIHKLSRKDVLLKRNKKCNRYYFLESGLIRFTYLYKENIETAWVVFENTFFTDIFSIQDNKPSFFELVALEDSIVYSIDKEDINKLSEKYPVFKDYLRKTWELNFRNIAEIKLLQQFGDAKTHYKFFLKNEQWMKRIPQKILASYIGITSFSLSRIRRNP